MKKSTVFRRAARVIESGDEREWVFAIKEAAVACKADKYWQVFDLFDRHFMPPMCCDLYWWPDFSEKSQSELVLALLFAAAMAESEGD